MASTIPPGAGSLVTALLAEIEKDREAKKKRQEEHKGTQQQHKEAKKSEDGDDSDADSDRSESPGPPDPRTCTVSGPGFAGGASGAPVNLIITCKDEHGKRCKEGGDDVVVKVVPAAGSSGTSNPYVDVHIEDKDNGMYVATYTALWKGAYNVTVEVNGRPLEGSPFPVFFGPPVDPATMAASGPASAATGATAMSTAIAAGTAALGNVSLGGAGASHPMGTTAMQNLPGTMPLSGLPGGLGGYGSLSSLPNGQPGGINPATAAAVAASLSTQATLAAAGFLTGGGAGVSGLAGTLGAATNPLMAAAFPQLATAAPVVDPQARTLLVSSITSKVTPDQLKQLFAVLGSVQHLQMLGTDMAMIEMTTLQDAQVRLSCTIPVEGIPKKQA